MNKLKSLLIALLVGSTSLFAQGDFEGEIKWGEPMKLKKKESAPIPIGSTTSSFYTRKWEKNESFRFVDDVKSSETLIRELD